MIHVCMDFHDLNKAFPKDNFPTSFIDQIVDECAGCEVFSFMDGFLGYNQIQIKPKDQHKMNFYLSLGYLHVSKNAFWPEECWSYLSARPCRSLFMTSNT
jgi:hypothetical protein